jgi:site-specific DNA-methyltransferase (adenine-specific)
VSAVVWDDDPFLTTPPPESLDGGTTNKGPLWHGASPRWGHAAHAMCSYQGMFPAKVVHYFVLRYSRPGDLVVDPFSGRGTTVLQARAVGRRTIGNDLNPLAYVLTRAKADPPEWSRIVEFIDELERDYERPAELDFGDEIQMLFHDRTLAELAYLRSRLLSKPMTEWSSEEAMVAACIAGILHGSYRSDGTSQYLSISMPNTFSLAPAYVKKFIRDKKLTKLDQKVFALLRLKVARQYLDSMEGPAGTAFNLDAVEFLAEKVVKGRVDLLVTSPPYLRVVNYGTSNWIRLWWLGLDGVARNAGEGRKSLDAELDHGHRYEPYREFILGVLQGIRGSLKKTGVAAVVIGDVATPDRPAIPLAEQLWEEIGHKTGLQLIDFIADDLDASSKVSRMFGGTRGQATQRDCVLVLARDDGRPFIYDADIDWAEPYKDGGPDAAHAALRRR